MTKTLADMTAEERADCVGMWASHQGHEDKDEPCGNLGIISEIDRDYAWIAFPKESAETYVFDLEDLAPRFDLPRAWTPDGEPELEQALAEETWEYSYHIQNAIGMWEHPTPRAGDPERWWDTRGEAEESALAAHEYGYPIRIVRRRVSQPEVINE